MVAVPSFGRASEIEAPPPPREAAATADLYERHAERIYRYCYSRLRSREEAEDATQTTFLNAFRGLRRGVMPELEQAWLFKIAENVCLSRVRTNVRRMRVESPTDLEPLHERLPAPPPARDELDGVKDALAGLPETQRRAILLREWQGLSYREIASALGTTQSAVETLIFRARRSLAKALSRADERGGRIRKGANVGSLLAGLKSLLVGGSTAAKVAAVAAAAGTAVAVGASEAPRTHGAPTPHRQAPVHIAPVAEPASPSVGSRGAAKRVPAGAKLRRAPAVERAGGVASVQSGPAAPRRARLDRDEPAATSVPTSPSPAAEPPAAKEPKLESPGKPARAEKPLPPAAKKATRPSRSRRGSAPSRARWLRPRRRRNRSRRRCHPRINRVRRRRNDSIAWSESGYSRRTADVAQLVEHFTRNEGVPGSSPGVGFMENPR
jgi:RNA polymerase sigma factor (sigma-70 family)